MANPRISILKLLIWEAGYANIANDNGGETFRGITRKNWPNWAGWKIIDEAKKFADFKLRLMSNAELTDMVIEFYTVNYWNKFNGSKINNQQTADSILDESVLEGVGSAIRREERNADLPETGKISDLLISKLNHLA